MSKTVSRTKERKLKEARARARAEAQSAALGKDLDECWSLMHGWGFPVAPRENIEIRVADKGDSYDLRDCVAFICCGVWIGNRDCSVIVMPPSFLKSTVPPDERKGVIIHELIHTISGCRSGNRFTPHSAKFCRIAREVLRLSDGRYNALDTYPYRGFRYFRYPDAAVASCPCGSITRYKEPQLAVFRADPKYAEDRYPVRICPYCGGKIYYSGLRILPGFEAKKEEP